MAIQKKNAKARLDKYYHLAKTKGYRARAAFKLIHLNKKYSFLQTSRCLLDLCAAPGSWLQVAAETMPQKSLIVGVDLAPIKPIPRVTSFQDDITTPSCRARIKAELKGWKADCVIHDGAPNVGRAWVQDAFSQNELVLASLKLAVDFLAPDGVFVTKVFRSKDSSKLEWIFKQLFSRVEQTKPPSSRNVSAETFYVCRGFKAPKHLDPRFLDANHAFAEVETAAPNLEARVFNPERKKRKREGYEEGDWTQFHEVAASEFVRTQDPIAMLGSLNRLHFRLEKEGGDIALAALDKLPETTQEVRSCCEDLKVLGRKEFKLLLRWRLKAREVFGLRQKKADHQKPEPDAGAPGEEVATLEPLDEEMKLQEELQGMKDAQSKVKRKERRKLNEQKQKTLVRQQMHMVTPADIGIEAGGPESGEGVFRLRDVDKRGDVRRQITRGRMVVEAAAAGDEEGEEDEEEQEDEDGDELERQLDGMYELYQSRREERDSRVRAKRTRMRARGEDEDDFEDFDARVDKSHETDDTSDDGDEFIEDEDDEDGSEDEEGKILTELRPREKSEGGLSGRARSFFQQDVFKDIGGLDAEESEDEVETERDSGVDVDSGSPSPEDLKPGRQAVDADDFDPEDGEDDASSIEKEVSSNAEAAVDEEDNAESYTRSPQEKEPRPNINIITAEAMTLAHSLATGKITPASLTDENYNKYSHRDTDGLPEWFLEDENRHSKPQRPVSAEAAKAIKEKLRALNARPIKKVREAKARKTLRTARRLEKMKKKGEGIVEAGEGTERGKAAQVAGMMRKARKTGSGKKGKQEVKVVRAGGLNKGAGRPRGVKGKYKMVDSRLKKDVRGEKRLARRIKGKK